MSTPSDQPPFEARPWPRISPLRRFGPVVIVIAAIVAVGVLASVNSSSTAASSPTATVPPAGRPSSNLPITYQMAKQEGRLADYDFGPGCDHSTGRLKMPTIYAPPCVPVWHGDNHGATTPGVTGTTIKVVYYQAPPGDLGSSLTGATDPPAVSFATAKSFVAMLNRVVETYGRKVALVDFNATGTSADAIKARADAITVSQQIGAFASLGGPAQTTAYQDELASQHVLCIGCGLSVPHASFVKDSPYLWSDFPAPDTLLDETLGFVVGQLQGKDAVYAGEASMRSERRVFGIVHYDTSPPSFGALGTQLTAKFAKYGFKAALDDTYLLDIPELPSEAATIVAHLKQAGVTTVIFAGDPIMPIYLTKAAASADYFPEWVEAGTVYVDTSTLARLYDQQEWAHAFGITSLGVSTPIALSSAYTLYRWYYGTEPPAKKTAGVFLPALQTLYLGLELGGPDLTPANFQAGLFRYPATGGGPTTPLIAFGDHGAPPLPSWALPDDFGVEWYDASATGPDEEGVDGTGLYEHVLGGKRFPAETIVRQPLGLFQPHGSVAIYDTLPPGDRPPTYPPWPGSPTAKG